MLKLFKYSVAALAIVAFAYYTALLCGVNHMVLDQNIREIGGMIGGLALVCGIAFFLFGLYFLPTIIARHHPNRPSIFIVNLFLGWTLVGWVISLAWAVSNRRVTA
jgi:hypothetical protein